MRRPSPTFERLRFFPLDRNLPASCSSLSDRTIFSTNPKPRAFGAANAFPEEITEIALVIPIILIFIYLKTPFYGWLAFILFVLAGVSDYFDGYFARIRKEISNLGTVLDPIADKLLVSAVILILTSKGVIEKWETIPALIILLREIAVSGLREFLAGIKVSVPVSKIAKFKTKEQSNYLTSVVINSSFLLCILPSLFFQG
mgnify:CR=1 FL=1